VRTNVCLAGRIARAVKIAGVVESSGGSICFHTFGRPMVIGATHADSSVQSLATPGWFPQIDEPGQPEPFRSSLQRGGGSLLVPSTRELDVDFDASLPPLDLQQEPLGGVRRCHNGSIALAP
jgi:hypothetical protein